MDDFKAIKEIERSKRAKKEEVTVKTESKKEVAINRISFDEWWCLRRNLIPKIHMKEIIKADFIGQGLSDKEEAVKFDKALEKYGVKI